jgi:hypothetical protein
MSLNISNVNHITSGPQPFILNERIDLGEIVQQSLQKFTLEKKSNIITRCETLPLVETNRGLITGAIESIIHMISSHSPEGSRLFLYIDCDEENSGKVDPELLNGFKRFRIRFHTNIDTTGSWRILHQKTIEDCKVALAQCNAGFAVNEIKSTGCLFSISLLGKM